MICVSITMFDVFVAPVLILKVWASSYHPTTRVHFLMNFMVPWYTFLFTINVYFVYSCFPKELCLLGVFLDRMRQIYDRNASENYRNYHTYGTHEKYQNHTSILREELECWCMRILKLLRNKSVDPLQVNWVRITFVERTLN
jgi:hypothetical protein